MSGGSDDDTEKSFEPTQKKLDDARKKGEFAKSTDLHTAAAYGGLLLAMLALGQQSTSAFGEVLSIVMDRSASLSEIWLGEGGRPLSWALFGALALPLLGWFLLPALGTMLSIAAQRAFVVAPDKIQPKLNKISPISNAKNKFGRSGLFEFAKSTVKLAIYAVVLGFYLYWQMPAILSTVRFQPQTALVTLGQSALGFLSIVVMIAAAIGVVDYMFQHQEHLRKNRMSRKEITDETKQSEGDPHLKQQRRQRGYEIAMNQMLADVPDADVVIVNPTHFAVALKWTRSSGSAPQCVAKGVDMVAARIRDVATEAGVPIYSDPPTARAIHAAVEIGEEIRPEHYQAVAAAIRFAENLRAKARKLLR